MLVFRCLKRAWKVKRQGSDLMLLSGGPLGAWKVKWQGSDAALMLLFRCLKGAWKVKRQGSSAADAPVRRAYVPGR